MGIYDVIIIGGGPAGYSAALYSCRGGLKTLLIEKMAPGGQMTLTGDIDNYPGFDEGVDGFTLGMKMQNGAERFGAETVYATVEEVELSGKIKKITADSVEYEGKAVIITTGANPRKLGLDGEEALTGRGIHYCAHCDGRFYKDKRVCVIGGGNSAAADSLYLANLCKEVYVVHRRDTLRADNIYKKQLEHTENIRFVWDSTVENVIADGKVTGISVRNVKTNKVTEFDTDGVFVSIGREPVTELFSGQLEIDSYGYIKAGEDTKTNIDGVFVAGDVRTKPLRQVVTAAADGAVAAHFAEEYINENR